MQNQKDLFELLDDICKVEKKIFFKTLHPQWVIIRRNFQSIKKQVDKSFLLSQRK